MSYKSLCAQVGKVPAWVAVVMPPLVSGMLYNANHQVESTVLGIGWIMGTSFAAGAEEFVPDMLRTKKIGVTRGSRILQGSQLAAYLLPMAFAVATILSIPHKPASLPMNQNAPVVKPAR